MQLMPEGDMLSVHLPESQIRDLMDGSLSLAAVNTPELCVVSGPRSHIESLRVKLETEGIKTQLLHTSHAFHSSMMDPILEEFKEQVGQIRNHIMTIARGSRVRDTASQTTYVSDSLTAGTVQEAIDELAMQVAEADAMDGAMGGAAAPPIRRRSLSASRRSCRPIPPARRRSPPARRRAPRSRADRRSSRFSPPAPTRTPWTSPFPYSEMA